MREYTAVEVEGIARNELRSDLEKLLREGARQMLEVVTCPHEWYQSLS